MKPFPSIFSILAISLLSLFVFVACEKNNDEIGSVSKDTDDPEDSDTVTELDGGLDTDTEVSFYCPPLPSCDGDIDFPDPNLEDIIVEILDLEPDAGQDAGVAITASYLEALEQIADWETAVSDLTGLHCAVNLKSLSLLGSIDDLCPLQFLFDLESIDLNDNNISDVRPISGLSSLINLGLEGNQVVDLRPLGLLTGLNVLNLVGNQLTTLSGLEPLVNLIQLDVSANQIVDITPLSAMTQMLTLTMDQNIIEDISVLSGMMGLFKLSLNNNGVSDLSPLITLTELVALSIENNKVVQLDALTGLTFLDGTINLMQNLITDLTPLADNDGIGTNDIVDLRLNPLDCAAGNNATAISVLTGRGATVVCE